MRITHKPSKIIVYAPDEDAAIKLAIAQFDIQRPWRNRLMAIREN